MVKLIGGSTAQAGLIEGPYTRAQINLSVKSQKSSKLLLLLVKLHWRHLKTNAKLTLFVLVLYRMRDVHKSDHRGSSHCRGRRSGLRSAGRLMI